MCHRIEQQAGFVEFSQLHFNEAQELFLQGHLDVQEVCHSVAAASGFV